MLNKSNLKGGSNGAQYHRDYRRKHPDKQRLYTLRRAAKLITEAIGCTFTYDEDGKPIQIQSHGNGNEEGERS